MSSNVISEFAHDWLPHATDSGIRRILDLLEQGNPMLIHGAFAKSCALGCLATHIAWHHPLTAHWNEEAGIQWLTRVAKLNPATSNVILAWDRNGLFDWELRQKLIAACKAELEMREFDVEACDEEAGELCWS
jgi:hypothetical protein